MNIFLCGLPTVGKTLFGKALAKYFSTSFFDVDDLIVMNYGNKLHSSACEIFQAVGEQEFTKLEIEALRSISLDNSVTALGGGTIMHQEACDIIKNRGLLVYLSLPIAQICERLLKRGLPERLKQAPNMEEILQQRIERMQRICDYHFPLDEVDLLDERSLLSACESLNTLLNQ
ncbi:MULTISPECIES: shikimate kinase [Chlamydia]|uniref:Shikimate kinase n=1 Tax=Chlamydophila parapsittaci TaxID=344886 RepID=A0ABX5VY71_9CHLA|nr:MULTISPECIES: shikimate kinase [Chlamydia]AEB55733.1 shikimate kinase [Chlamydia psittaci 6BC]AUH45973.1 shikimate kinase [Chlamydia psittaci]ODJ01051.1 shikimate kinase [Chlamydia psittaci]ODJ01739.1 shikimate kinase [Chlamydia psittaci]ODJ03008.1 shikimate kinase [Chlamydia psittaci]